MLCGDVPIHAVPRRSLGCATVELGGIPQAQGDVQQALVRASGEKRLMEVLVCDRPVIVEATIDPHGGALERVMRSKDGRLPTQVGISHCVLEDKCLDVAPGFRKLDEVGRGYGRDTEPELGFAPSKPLLDNSRQRLTHDADARVVASAHLCEP